MASVSFEAWEAKGVELFGPDKENWRFVCPSCGNEMSIARARAEFPQLKGTGWRPESECIGRYIDVPAAQLLREAGVTSQRCDWCAYGLLSGPLHVFADGRNEPIAAFDFAGKPFTSEAPRG